MSSNVLRMQSGYLGLSQTRWFFWNYQDRYMSELVNDAGIPRHHIYKFLWLTAVCSHTHTWGLEILEDPSYSPISHVLNMNV